MEPEYLPSVPDGNSRKIYCDSVKGNFQKSNIKRMPLHGKIVVIKRSGGDGTEFPLTASCLFGRRPDCDIRIQIPQVSKEHCRIDLNENKEIILTNLSSVNPTLVNGEALQQSERLKHGDVITIVDRSFRFEYPPAPTPKKRTSIGGRTKKILQDQHAGDTVAVESGEKRISEVATDHHLKDGTNNDNIQRSLEKSAEVESTEDGSLLQSSTGSPFSDLYQMIRKSLDVKPPHKSPVGLLQTPASRFYSSKPGSVRKAERKSLSSTEVKTTPKNKACPGAVADEFDANETPKSIKLRRSNEVPASHITEVQSETQQVAKPEASPRQESHDVTSQKLTVNKEIEKISSGTPGSPMKRRRSSRELMSVTPGISNEQEKVVSTPKTEPLTNASLKDAEKEQAQNGVEELATKQQSGALAPEMPTPQERKRVSFGRYLSPELFDKRLPPSSPLRKGAAPRTSLRLSKPRQSLLKASVIGLDEEFEEEDPATDSPNVHQTVKSPKTKKASPNTPRTTSTSPKTASAGKRSSSSSSTSLNTPSPGKKSPKSRSISPNVPSAGKRSSSSSSTSLNTPSPGKKSPKSRSISPNVPSAGKRASSSSSTSLSTPSPGKKSPKSRSTSPKTPSTGRRASSSSSTSLNMPSSGQKSTKSPMTQSPETESAKSRSTSPKTPLAGMRSSSSGSTSLNTPSPRNKSPKSQSTSPKTPSVGKRSSSSSFSSLNTPSPGRKSTKSPKTPSETESAKSRCSSPKVPSAEKNSLYRSSTSLNTPSPGKNSPKSRSTSPKTPSPEMESAKSRSASPRRTSPRQKSPKYKVETPKGSELPKLSASGHPESVNEKTPTGKRRSSLVVSSLKTPLRSEVQTSTVQGRFSVSRVETPSPAAEDTVANSAPLTSVTPKVPLMRESMKRSSRKSRVTSSAVKVMRQSGISRGSMKAMNSWANIVKFGKTKLQAPVPAPKNVTKQAKKKAVVKPQTPARHLRDHVSTGHAASPATIVVGRAHKRKVVNPTGAAPRVISNTALLQKNMKMDEDLTGIVDMFKTPVNKRMRKSIVSDASATKTPQGNLTSSVVEPSLLNTPEEPGEMAVSPLTVASAVKSRIYNSEAVHRLLLGDQSRSDIAASGSPNKEQDMDLKMDSVATPKQKPELPQCLTGVKRIMKTPKQKAEPVQDIRGKLLVTPKLKPEQPECLTGVKRIFERPEAEAVDDLKGNIVQTPKQIPEQKECLTGVKRMMKTPKQKAEPVEDIRGKRLITPKLKPEQPEYLTGVKRIFTTPKERAEPIEDLRGKLLKTPKEKSAPVEDMVGVKRLMKTPKEKSEPVVENFGIKRLMKSPRLRGAAPVEDFEGLQELMEEPLSKPTEQMDGNEVTDPTSQDEGSDTAKEPDAACEKQRDVPSVLAEDEPSQIEGNSTRVDVTKDETDSAAVVEVTPQEFKELNLPEERHEVEMATCQDAEMKTVCSDSSSQRKSVQGRSAKTVESEPIEEMTTEHFEEPMPTAPARGRRGKKTAAATQPAVRQTTRGRNPKSNEHNDDQLTVAPKPEAALKPTRGRNAKNVHDEQTKPIPEVPADTENELQAVSDQMPPTHLNHSYDDGPPVVEEAVVKPKRGRKPKQASFEKQVQLTLSEVRPSDVIEDVTQLDKKTNEVCDQLEVSPSGNEEDKSDVAETVSQAAVNESRPEMETTCKTIEVDAVSCNPDTRKKSVPGRSTKTMESEPADEMTTEHFEEPMPTAPARGRRGKKTAAATQPAVRQTTRGRNPKSNEHHDDQLTVAPKPEAALKPTRGRNAKKVHDEQTKPIPEVPADTEDVPKAVSDQTPPTHVNHKLAGDGPPAVEEAVTKPKRGRKPKRASAEEQVQPTPSEVRPSDVMDDVTKFDKETSDQLEVSPNGNEDKSDVAETVSQAAVNESRPEMETTCKTIEVDTGSCNPDTRKKSVRGRKPTVAAAKALVDKQEVAEKFDNLAVASPVLKRRGRKAVGAAPPAVRQTTRNNKNAKPKASEEQDESVTAEVAFEPSEVKITTSDDLLPLVSNLAAEDLTEQAAPINAGQAENDSAPLEEVALKPKRGRPSKKASVESAATAPEKRESVSEQQPRRGRKVNDASVQQKKVAADTLENKQQPQRPARAKRGRSAEQVENGGGIPPGEEPNEQATADTAEKPRRGGRKAKESTEVQDEPVVNPTEKPKRGRRGKATEEIQTTAQLAEEKVSQEGEENKNAADSANTSAVEQPDTAVIKSRRGLKTSVQHVVSQTIPVKRGRRGSANTIEEGRAKAEAPVSLEPAPKRRRGATAPGADSTETSATAVANSDKDRLGRKDSGTESKMSKKCVSWKARCDVFEIPNPTPVKAAGGTKLQLEHQDDDTSTSKRVPVKRGRSAKSTTPSASAATDSDRTDVSNGNKTEEDPLSVQADESQPSKRARRGPKVPEATTEVVPTNKRSANPQKGAAKAGAQPTRRGRSAMK